MSIANEPAFPGTRMEDVRMKHAPDVVNMVEVTYPGLTKRELFAAMAMQGYLTCPQPDAEFTRKTIAKFSVGYADALLAELDKTEVKG